MPAAAVFAIILGIFITVSSITLYTGSKNHELDKRIIAPLKNVAASLEKQMMASDSEIHTSTTSNYSNTTTFSNNTVTVGSDVNVTITATGSPKKTPPQSTYPPSSKTYVPPTYTYDDSAYQQALKDQEEWSKQVEARNKQWFDEQNAKNDAAAKASYDAAVDKMNQETEAWKKAHGF